MSDLAEDAEELVDLLNFHIASINEAQLPEDIAIAADSACTYFQGVAICELLLDAEVDAFFQLMVRSARTRRWLLIKSKGDHRYPAQILKISNTRGLFAAIVAKDWPLAREIAELSSFAWNAKVEYEDDFLYAQLLHGMVTNADLAAQRVLLDEYARALDGAPTARLRLCQGLLEGHAEDAIQAFQDLIEERHNELEEISKTILGSDELFGPLAAVYVEGLAWLRLLDAAKIPTSADYTFCPSMARIEDFAPYRPEGFPD